MESIQTAIQIQSSLASIGSPPVEETQVKGEETDSLVTGVGNSWLYIAALIAVVSAGKTFCGWLQFVYKISRALSQIRLQIQ